MASFRTIQADSWEDFRGSLYRYAQEPRGRRDELWFRGQGDSSWSLATTLDRFRASTSVSERQSINRDLLHAFKIEAQHIGVAETLLESENRLELLARHHGLPSPLMDWTLSPYIAAYFAYKSRSESADDVSVWCLDIKRVDWASRQDVELLWHDLPIFDNRRALQQRGVFIRTAISEPLEAFIPEAMTRFDLPAHDRDAALQDLDEMLVNATTMFYDLEGAASTAVIRLTGS